MKIHVSKREVLALCTFIVPKPTANLEQAHVRMSAWEALGCTELAYEVADLGTLNRSISVEGWIDRSPFVADLTSPIVDFLLKQLEGEVPGAFSEVLRPVQDRLISVRDKTYKLPQALRAVEAPAVQTDA